MPTPTYTPIASTTLSSAQSSVTFNSLSGYRDLVLVTNARADNTNFVFNSLRFNGDSGTNYNYVSMYNSGSGGFSYQEAATAISSDQIAKSNAASGFFTTVIYNIMDYSVTDKHKSVFIRNHLAVAENTFAFAARWANTAAITSLTVSINTGNYVAGSTFSLYGVIA